jgi:HEAT repeat protein
LKSATASADPTERYWGLIGIRLLAAKATDAADAVLPLLKDKHAGIRTTAAQALYALGKKDAAADALIAEVSSDMDSYALLNLLNTLRRYDLLDRLPNDWAKGKKLDSEGQSYVERFSKRTKGN